MKPDLYCYNHVLLIWAKSRHEYALVRVTDIVREMSLSKDEDCKPNTDTYIRLMTALYYSRDHNSPWHLLRTFRFLQREYANGDERLQPSPRALNLTLMACATFSGTDVQSIGVRSILRQVGELILTAEVSVLSKSGFRLFFDASRHLALSDSSLISSVYTLSKSSNMWDEEVEEVYRKLYTNP